MMQYKPLSEYFSMTLRLFLFAPLTMYGMVYYRKVEKNMYEYTVGIYEYIRLSTFISTFNEVSSNVEKTNQILTSQVTCVKNHWKENYIKA